ncbi:hypothetical protein PG997_005897 [Apiospora hydei]|uniref:Uncharacterized protein n=1 Tax=Apiospora hydei TaxID=1337664 RepID=A0ABR1WM58_9PEZI
MAGAGAVAVRSLNYIRRSLVVQIYSYMYTFPFENRINHHGCHRNTYDNGDMEEPRRAHKRIRRSRSER